MAKKPFKRERFTEKIQNEINTILKMELRDATFKNCSVTKVEMNNDFSRAKVFWDTFDLDSKEKLNEALLAASSKVRTKLSQRLSTRTVPALEFIYDEQFESESHISNLLSEEAKLGKKF